MEPEEEGLRPDLQALQLQLWPWLPHQGGGVYFLIFFAVLNIVDNYDYDGDLTREEDLIFLCPGPRKEYIIYSPGRRI